MARKKRSDMTPMERMEFIMKGATWDDGEAVGIEMLARCMALHVYARKEGGEYFHQLMKRICQRADEWAHEPGNPFVLAMASVGHRLERGEYQFRTDVLKKEHPFRPDGQKEEKD